MLRAAALLTAGTAAGSLLLLVRNIIIARLISVEDFGIASTFAVTMALIEMMTYIGAHQMIVQDRDGNDPAMQAGLQGFQVLRGVFAGLAMLLIAGPYARFLGIPEVIWAYQMIALIPVMNGFTHFDLHRLKRRMRFGPQIMASTVPAAVSVVAAWPLAAVFGDYRVMLYAILLQQAVIVLVSHLVAERPYALSFRRDLFSRVLGFGWPLLINNALLFAVMNGEKLIVGRELGMAALAIFSLAFSFTQTPTSVLGGSAQSFFLPQLSAAQDRPRLFGRLAQATLQSSLLIGISVAVGMSLVGPPLVSLLFGDKYNALLPILVWLAIVQAGRVFKAGPAVVAMARGQTGNAMMANMFRVVSLPLSWYLALETGSLLSVIFVAIGAEAAGYMAALLLVWRRSGLPPGPCVMPLLLALLTLAMIAVDLSLYPPQAGLIANLHVFKLAVIIPAVAMLVTMHDLRRYILARKMFGREDEA
jgi:O-antigen/teichoic acid export membrane protein